MHLRDQGGRNTAEPEPFKSAVEFARTDENGIGLPLSSFLNEDSLRIAFLQCDRDLQADCAQLTLSPLDHHARRRERLVVAVTDHRLRCRKNAGNSFWRSFIVNSDDSHLGPFRPDTHAYLANRVFSFSRSIHANHYPWGLTLGFVHR